MFTRRPRMPMWIAAFAAIGFGCGDAGNANGFGGTLGPGGTGATGGGPVAEVSCTVRENGCDDGNECTIDGMCESITGQCIGRAPEPEGAECGSDAIFVCNGEGACVGCNADSQCDSFFPPDECRERARCVAQACPLPEARPDGTPCSTGACRSGVCTSPWAPKEASVHMLCGVDFSLGGSFGSPVFESSMDLRVAPTEIAPGETFSAAVSSAIRLPRGFLQEVVIGLFPAPFLELELTGARAEVESTGVVAGGPVGTTVAPLPQTIPIRQGPNPGDLGGQACDTAEDCPLAAFGQRCEADGECGCACRSGCTPAECANVVVADAVLNMETIQGAIYSAEQEGEVCFDAGGLLAIPDFDAPARTGIRVSAFPGPLAIDCDGGFFDDNGTPNWPHDDSVSDNPPQERVCFPIGDP
ncbi:MAG: hypothetical protein AAF500_09715 [Myxococcota bacterium]